MARSLNVPPQILSVVIRERVPLQPSLSQLKKLYATVVEGLFSDYAELAS
jgi:hypothetical protein